jgi:NADPH:quinone reductase-like Zn-dependent oxidoreductase
VLVRVRALSCNYRDKGLFRLTQRIPANRFTPVGSEFMAEVVDVGHDVTAFRPGDRVLPDHHYTGGGVGDAGVREGVITNQASRAYHVLPERKLRVVPDGMPDEVAASFSLNAQTAYSMARKLAPRPGANVLVTSATANCSLFVIGLLSRRGANVFACTTSPRAAPRLAELGASTVTAVDRASASGALGEAVLRTAKQIGGFDGVIDPFFDLHALVAVEALRPFGTYVTCGLVGQHATPRGADSRPDQAGVGAIDGGTLLQTAILKNLTLVGNCIGVREDLDAALADYAAGRLASVVDSVYDGDAVRPFFERTFNDPARFGKVVFRYA